jgi:hypothetical protein
MKLTAAIIGMGLAVAGAAAAAQAAELLQNGDFTQLSSGLGQLNTNTTAYGWYTSGPDATGYEFVMNNGNAGSNGEYGGVALWTQANGGANSWNGATLSGNGNFLAMDGDFQTTAVSQTVHDLIPGDYYTITFNTALSQQYGFYGDTIQDITVSWGGYTQELYSSYFGSSYSLPSTGFSGWTQWTGILQASSSSEVLSFLANGNLPVPPFALLSDVSVTGPAAPEPATWALMGLGFAGLGFAAYRRRARLGTFA